MKHWADVRGLLFTESPYKGFDAEAYPLDLQGWNSTAPIFAELLAKVQPGLIIEVGSWKGASAVHMAMESRRLGLDAHILCVDTWLGSAEFWVDLGDRTRYGSLGLRHGYPTVYYQFLANVVKSGVQDRITPFPLSSSVAAEVLTQKGVTADLIYIDASHEYRDVLTDLQCWWEILGTGGVMFGDDIDSNWPGVDKAVREFGRDVGVDPAIHKRNWVLKKV